MNPCLNVFTYYKTSFFLEYFVPAALVKKCQKIFTPGCLWSHPCYPASHQNAGSNSTSSSEAHYLLMACQRATITNLSCFPSGIAWDFIWFDFMLHTGLGWHRPWYASKCRGLLLLILFLKIPPTLLNFSSGGWGCSSCCDSITCGDWLLPQVLNLKNLIHASLLLMVQRCM